LRTTDPPKIVRVITRMNIGGPARHVTILATRSGPEFTTVLLTGEPSAREGSLLDEAEQAGARIVRVPHLSRPVSPIADLLAFIWLFRYFRRERPAIVATHTAKAGTVGRFAAALAGVPVIVHTFHGHVLDGYFGRVSTSVFVAIERLLGRLTSKFIAISPEIASDLDRLAIGRGKTVVVRLGLELDHLGEGRAGRLRHDLGIPDGAPVVGIVGRLVPIKAHDLFLDAAHRLAATNSELHFAIVGDGELWDQLHRDVAAAGLADRVHFAGWRDDLAEVYCDLDVVVCCSRNEGTPVSVIEACAAGRPVIGTPVGGMTDIISEGVNGLLVPSGDAAALAAAIAGLIDDPERRIAMGAAGRKMVLERYGADRMVNELKQIYSTLLQRKTVKLEAI
jgi:glycosyltransferase involved in cell wall biosynthesis